MPDVGGYEPRRLPRGDDPRGAHARWSDAFAALPKDAPDAGGWQRLTARLTAQATPARARWPLWLAVAASLALVAVIPLRLLPRADVEDVPATRAAIASPSAPARPLAVAAAAVAANVSDIQPIATPIRDRDLPRRVARDPASPPPVVGATARPLDDAQLASTDASAPAALDPLYAQSAQLEALLELARDDRVASGSSAALSDGLDAELATIDASLIQRGLDDTQRADLWRQRVDTLQQLVGIETTNRLYAARGERHDAALVSID